MADLRMDDPGQGTLVRQALTDPVGAPLGQYLRGDLDEERALGMWRGIDARLARSSGTPARSRWLVLAAAALLVVCFFGLRRAPTPALHLATGAAPVLLQGASSGHHEFDDGSSVELGRDGRLEVLRNDEQVFMSALRRGEGTFDIRPGARKWVVEVGLASVEANGARFTVSRAAGLVRVEVERGPLVVTAESLPGGRRRLEAGHQLEITPAALRPEPTPRAIEPKPQPSAPAAASIDKVRARALRPPPAASTAKPPEAAREPGLQARQVPSKAETLSPASAEGSTQWRPLDPGGDWQAEQVGIERRSGNPPIEIERPDGKQRAPGVSSSRNLKIWRAP